MDNVVFKRIQAILLADATLELENVKAKVLEIRKQRQELLNSSWDNDEDMDELNTNTYVLRAAIKNVDAAQETLNRAISAYRTAKGQE